MYTVEQKQNTYREMCQKLSRKERRQLGLLPRQILFGVRQLQKDGVITDDMSTEEMATMYLMDVTQDVAFVDAWSGNIEDTYGFDWEQFRILVEMVLEWLMKFLPLFI